MKTKSIVKFTLLIAIFLLFNCSTCQTSDYEKIADKITVRTAEKLREQKNLVLIGIGGRMMHDIQMMAISFNYYHKVDLKTARKLITYAIDEYLSDINESEKVRSYLHEYPFTAKNIAIRIFVHNPGGSHLNPEKIYLISAVNGKIIYYTRGAHPRQAICEETYDQATQLVKNENKINN